MGRVPHSCTALGKRTQKRNRASATRARATRPTAPNRAQPRPTAPNRAQSARPTAPNRALSARPFNPSTLAQVQWARRNEAAGVTHYHKRFFSAEGAYSHRVLHTNGMKLRIARKQFTGLELTTHANSEVYVTQPAYTFYLKALILKSEGNTPFMAILHPFSDGLWLCIVALVFASAFTMILLDSINSPEELQRYLTMPHLW